MKTEKVTLKKKSVIVNIGLINVVMYNPVIVKKQYMNKHMNIRKCLETDIIPASLFYDRVIKWLEAHINYPRWDYGIYPSEEYVREMAKAGEQYVCTYDDKIVGTFALNTKPQGNYRKGHWKAMLADGSYMSLHALAIDPEAQRQGIGTEILQFCIEKAKAEGCKAIRVDIVPDNYPAKKFFEKNGFTFAGDIDLELGIENIPFFSLYELNW